MLLKPSIIHSVLSKISISSEPLLFLHIIVQIKIHILIISYLYGNISQKPISIYHALFVSKASFRDLEIAFGLLTFVACTKILISSSIRLGDCNRMFFSMSSIIIKSVPVLEGKKN